MKELITEIDSTIYKEKIVKAKWSIHEHATHIAVGDIYGFQTRLNDFRQEEMPTFEPLSGDNFDEYFEQPFEIEAHGRERGLMYAFMLRWKEIEKEMGMIV